MGSQKVSFPDLHMGTGNFKVSITRAEGLEHALKEGRIDVKSLQTTATELLTLMFPNNEHIPPVATKPETLQQAQIRIATQYKTEMDNLLLIALPGGPIAFRDAVLAFESAASLGARDLMTIYGSLRRRANWLVPACSHSWDSSTRNSGIMTTMLAVTTPRKS
jgi:hypothetical protein